MTKTRHKFLCINSSTVNRYFGRVDDLYLKLEIGKIYDCEYTGYTHFAAGEPVYYFLNVYIDNILVGEWSSKNFVKLDEWRESQIKILEI